MRDVADHPSDIVWRTKRVIFAAEQENVAEIAANRAKLVLAEAEVPKAMADAFRSGNIGIMDYQRLKNIESDTRMRSQIAAGEESHINEQRERKQQPGQS